jgi:hypothetical protein
MKFSRSEIHCKTYRIPRLRFEDQHLTSFSGLIADSAECDHRFRWEGDQAIHAKMTAGRSEATRDGT